MFCLAYITLIISSLFAHIRMVNYDWLTATDSSYFEVIISQRLKLIRFEYFSIMLGPKSQAQLYINTLNHIFKLI